MNDFSPDELNLRRAHPLARALCAVLPANARVLEIGSGRGRNTAALRGAGFAVTALPDDAMPHFEAAHQFDAALSTHAFLHGTPADVAEMLARAAAALKSGAPLYGTFASKGDARYGAGRRIADDTYAPESGDEAGVPHAYFDEAALRALIGLRFSIDALDETPVDDVVGRWAHAQRPAGSVHWFLRARRL